MQSDARNRWYVLAAVAVGVFMSTVDGSVVNIALPTFVEVFNTDFASVQWIALAYMLVLTTLIPVMGRLGDMFGMKRLFLAGFSVFTAASLACALGPTLAALIVARMVQALGAAAMSALGPAIVSEAFPHERGKALGIIGAAVSCGVVVGPTFGGLLLSVASWPWLFLINLPVGAVGIYMVRRYISAHKPKPVKHFDLAGACLLFVALATFLLALTQGQRLGFGHAAILTLAVTSVGTATGFILWEKRVTAPMLDLTLFANAAFSGQLLCATLLFSALSGVVLMMPFYLQGMLHFSTQRAGLLMAVTPVLMTVVTPLAGMAADKFGPAHVTRVGLSCVLCGIAALSTLQLDTSVSGYVLRFALVGTGMGIFQPANNSAIMGAAPTQRVGTASGLMAVSRTLGQVIGQGTLGGFWAWRTMEHAGGGVTGGAGRAAPVAQMAGLHDMVRAVLLLVGLAWLINLRFQRPALNRP